jgi:hypothetical protein
MAAAGQIAHDGLRTHDLDCALVTLEQAKLQAGLQRLDSPDRVRLNQELNALMNLPNAILCLPVASRLYSQVLREARQRLGAPLDFSQTVHRVMIGMTLIGMMREEKCR